EYEALSSKGARSRGIIDAESEAMARQQLRDDGMYPVSVVPSGASQKKASKANFTSLFSFERIGKAEITAFTRQLATLLGAGIPLDSALSSLVEQTRSPALKKQIAQLKQSVSTGESLSGGMQHLPDQERLFSAMYINMVRAGEASGSLDRVLTRLADYGERFETVRGRLRAALIYPAFMTMVGAAVLFILITFVIPDIMQAYSGMEQALPLPTKLLLSLSSFIQNHWLLLLLGVVGSIFALKMAAVGASGRRLHDLMLLRLPVIGRIVRKSVLFRFSSTMESLLRSGVDIVDSLRISKRVVDNVCIEAVIDEAIEGINSGRPLAAAFSRSEYFPATFVQMIGVGEASGQLEGMLEIISRSSERDLESSMMSLTALIEPVLIVIMGVLVGFIVTAILLPIFEMNQVIG
ncbi:MAG: type II secretion system F family protein, partial [Desulfocapsaceae bacterium]